MWTETTLQLALSSSAFRAASSSGVRTFLPDLAASFSVKAASASDLGEGQGERLTLLGRSSSFFLFPFFAQNSLVVGASVFQELIDRCADGLCNTIVFSWGSQRASGSTCRLPQLPASPVWRSSCPRNCARESASHLQFC